MAWSTYTHQELATLSIACPKISMKELNNKLNMISVLQLCVLLFCISSLAAHAGDDHDYMVVETSSLEPKDVCSDLKVGPSANATWVPLNHLHGPCMPAGRRSEKAPSLEKMLHWDQVRSDQIRERISRSEANRKIMPPEDVEVENAQYTQQYASDFGMGTGAGQSSWTPMRVVPEAIGNSAFTQRMVLDTSSDVPWVQCRPCPVPPCHPQPNPIFDPTRSSTYVPLPCSSAPCRGLGPYANGCSNNQCQYIVRYMDGSQTTGTYSSDALTLTPTNVVSNFRFGCSHFERGRFNAQTDGIMALGGRMQSLAAQTAVRYGNAFSYCFPPTASSRGFFSLGRGTAEPSRYVLTPMIRRPWAPTFYLVRLEAIIVANRRLNIPPAVFAAGSVMDSIAIITQLPATAYSALRAAFQNEMRAYPRAPPKGNLDTCYKFGGNRNIRVPRVALVFDRGATVELHASGILFNDCLAFTSTGDDTSAGIIGNVQQRTLEVLYNVGASAFGFRRDVC